VSENKIQVNIGKIISHRFLDESGDTTFFGNGKRLIIGQGGVSLSFSIGMVKINGDLNEVRQQVQQLQQQVENDQYLNIIPSIQKKINAGGFYFHATDDSPEVRQIMYKFIKNLDCSLEMVVARKIQAIYTYTHKNRETEFYADLLSHLLKNKLTSGQKLVLNISHRSNSTTNRNLEAALCKAKLRASKKHDSCDLTSQIVFNIQNHRTEPLLNIADYMCWSVQRVFEKGEMRYYDYIKDKISVVVDIYDEMNYKGSKNYYRKNNPLSPKNRLSPPSP